MGFLTEQTGISQAYDQTTEQRTRLHFSWAHLSEKDTFYFYWVLLTYTEFYKTALMLYKRGKGALTWTIGHSLWTGCPNPTVIPYYRNRHYFTGGELEKLPKVLQPTSIGISTALFPHGNVWPNNTEQLVLYTQSPYLNAEECQNPIP